MHMKVYWCNNCHVPIINKEKCTCGHSTKYIATDLRPVFPETKYLMYQVTGDKRYMEAPVWVANGNRYIFDGVAELVPFGVMESGDTVVINERVQNRDYSKDYDVFHRNIQMFIHRNDIYSNEIEYAASDYIQKTVAKYSGSLPVVSFSGGKDSTVVSHLVRRALSNPSILHLFGDTTLEFPQTYEYIERFRKTNNKTPFLVSKSEHDFMNLCKSMGPPSRVMNWCCTVFKTGPLNNIIRGFTKDRMLLTFYGIRKAESVSRSDYEDMEFNAFDKIKVSLNRKKTYNTNAVIESADEFWTNNHVDISPKIAKQRVTSPIFDWFDIDLWLYILKHEVDFNDAYRYGFARVGCWCCPNNSKWSTFLSDIYMHEQSVMWNNFLIDFARQIGKEDAEVYVATGKWKARQGGAGLVSKQINVEAKPCVDEEFARTFELTKPITNELYEYFKPFGKISKDLGKKLLNEVFILDSKTRKPIMKLQGKLGSYQIKIIAINPNNYRLLSQRIDCQIRKYQSCIGCLGCISKCPMGAISYIDSTYHINEDKCTGCLECNVPWRGGCLMSKVLAVKQGG